MTPEERQEAASRRPVPHTAIPTLQRALSRRGGASEAVCAEILAGIDDPGLERLISCGWAETIDTALRRERRRRRILSRTASIDMTPARRIWDLDTDEPDVYAGHSSTEQETSP